MSRQYPTVMVTCDHPSCLASTTISLTPRGDGCWLDTLVEQALLSQGWCLIDGKEYCPACKSEHLEHFAIEQQKRGNPRKSPEAEPRRPL